MQLHNAKYGSKVRLIECDEVAPCAKQVKIGDVFTVLRYDGMYVNVKDKDGDITHIKAWAEVENI